MCADGLQAAGLLFSNSREQRVALRMKSSKKKVMNENFLKDEEGNWGSSRQLLRGLTCFFSLQNLRRHKQQHSGE